MKYKKKNMTVGQIVDEVADQYFAAGADAFTSQLMALQYVERVLTETIGSLSNVLRSFDSSSEGEVPGDA